jgi:hypothetical protein
MKSLKILKSIGLLCLFTSFNVSASPKVIIADDNDWLTANQEKALESQILRASKFYHQEMSFFPAEINVAIDASKCFRTGYDYKANTLKFCKKGNVQNFGLDSVDVINHEVFHYNFCHQYPANCEPAFLKNKDNVAKHEGLADFFSYKMNPDTYFGENFKVGVSHLREYKNDLCYNMVVRSPHLKGSSITGYIINKGFTFNDLKAFFSSFDFADMSQNSNEKCFEKRTEPILKVQGRSQSPLHKYWIEKNDSVEFESTLVGQYSYRTFAPTQKLDFTVQNNMIKFSSRDESGVESIFLVISQNGKDLGVIKLLIGVRKD